MNVLVKPDTEIMELWNRQIPSDDIIYRPTKYLKHRIIEEDNAVIMENMMTIEVIVISIDEYNALMNNTLKDINRFLYLYLIKEWFLIPEDMDERSMVYLYKNRTRPVRIFDEYIYQFIVLSTTGCNARCSYCYEKGVKPVHMSKETAVDVANYMISKSDPNDGIHIRWFGGEPLYNVDAIDTICNVLKEKGKTFWSSMMSNGFEFDDDMIKRSKSLWNLRKIQITLDGTHDEHNRIKNFKDKTHDPFNKILYNIEKLADMGIEVSIRLNIERENVDDMHDLIIYLKDRFKDIMRISIYPTPIFEGDYVGFVQRDDEWRNYVYKKCIELEELVKECGFNGGRKLQIKSNTPYNSTQCMADFPRSQLITPDGHLGVCEHYIEDPDSLFGSIYDDPKDYKLEKVLKFREFAKEYPECKDCWYYPRCIRVKKCPTSALCNEAIRMDREYLINKMLYSTYMNYKIGKEGVKNENSTKS